MDCGVIPLPPRSGGEGFRGGGVMRSRRPVPRKKDKRVPRARSLRRAMTDAERKLWWSLRELKIEGSHFRRQATIGPYYADFACHERKLVIEVDGGGHAEEERIAADEARPKFIVSHGYRVLRFWNHDVLKDSEAVMATIYKALDGEADAPHPWPLPTTRESAWGEGNWKTECQK